MNTPVTGNYGGTFASVEERDAWDAYIEERLAAAEQSELLSEAEADREIEAIINAYRHVPHSMA